MGVIEILNTLAGHSEVALNAEPLEAKKQIDELLKKGYTLFVKIDDQDYRVKMFDEATNEIVALAETEKRVSATDVKLTAMAPAAGG